MSRVLRDTHPKARKPNSCDSCFRVIERGETYHRQDAVGDDGLYSWVSCQHCEAVLAFIWATDPDASYYDEGIDLHEYLRDGGNPELLASFERDWSGVEIGALKATLTALRAALALPPSDAS